MSSELKKDYPDSFDTFEEIWDKTILELKSCLKSDTNRAVPVRNGFPEIWQEFFELCTEFDISAVDIFTKTDRFFPTTWEIRYLKSLKKLY